MLVGACHLSAFPEGDSDHVPSEPFTLSETHTAIPDGLILWNQ